MKVGELFVQLGVKADTLKVRDFSRAIGNLPLEVAGALAAIAGMDYHFAQLATRAFDTAIGFQMFEAQTGLSAQKLQKWQIAAEAANVSTDAVASSVTSLQRNLEQIKLGRGNISPFLLLGVSPYDDAFDVLKNLRNAIKGQPRARAVNLLSEMGIDPQMMVLLEMSEERFNRLAGAVRGMSESQRESLLTAKRALVQWNQEVRQSIVDMVANMTTAIEKSEGMAKAIKAIGVALAGIAVYASSIAAVTAALTALALALNDIAKYQQGKPSVTGDILQKIDDSAKVTIPDGSKKYRGELIDEFFQNLWTKLSSPFTAMMGHGPQIDEFLRNQAQGAQKIINQTFNVQISSAASGPNASVHEAAEYLKGEVRRAAQQIDNEER